VHLVGGSIGAWRMATACLNDPVAAFNRLEHDYIHQHYELLPGQKRPTADFVSERFGESLQAFYGGRIAEVLNHPRYRLHIVTSRGRHVLAREHGLRTPLGYAGAFFTNAVRRKAMGAWLERVVFSSAGLRCRSPRRTTARARIDLTEANFMPALQASCSIPFVLRAVHDIPGAPPGAYWDGGITDYHLHLDYRAAAGQGGAGLVLYPHFQQAVVPGWLDKALKWRHGATPFLDTTVVLAPDPAWVAHAAQPQTARPHRLHPLRQRPDGAGKAWSAAAGAAQQLADEFGEWVEKPDLGRVQPL
jgi:hypothetical protein